MKDNIKDNNLEIMEEQVLNKENIAEILELENDSVIQVSHEERNEFAKENKKYVRVSRDNYTEQEIFDKVCIICGKTSCRGIIILDKKICLECEEKAVKADVKSEFYSDYKDKIIRNVVGKLKNENLG